MLQSYPQPGSLLSDRYRLIRMIGEGGMGVVFEAQNTLTERKVAIKWLHTGQASSPEAAQRLVREATATCRVRHPNVVDVYDVVRDGDSIFLVMELLEGEPLEALLERGGMPLHQLVALLLGAMRGVAEAHRHKVIHRDIHPANIFLARQVGQPHALPKVLDFGISKMIGDDAPSLTRSGTTMGTPLYMSYEQLCSVSDVDERTDVYSFGVILYEALTGRPPFDASSFPELAVKIATATPIPPKQLRPDLPAALERLISWAMQRDREQRIGSMDEFIRELEPFAHEHSFRAQMTDADRQLPLVVPRSARLSRTPAPSEPQRPASTWSALGSPAEPVAAPVAAPPRLQLVSAPPAERASGPAALAPSLPPRAPAAPAFTEGRLWRPLLLGCALLAALVALTLWYRASTRATRGAEFETASSAEPAPLPPVPSPAASAPVRLAPTAAPLTPMPVASSGDAQGTQPGPRAAEALAPTVPGKLATPALEGPPAIPGVRAKAPGAAPGVKAAPSSTAGKGKARTWRAGPVRPEDF